MIYMYIFHFIDLLKPARPIYVTKRGATLPHMPFSSISSRMDAAIPGQVVRLIISGCIDAISTHPVISLGGPIKSINHSSIS